MYICCSFACMNDVLLVCTGAIIRCSVEQFSVDVRVRESMCVCVCSELIML